MLPNIGVQLVLMLGDGKLSAFQAEDEGSIPSIRFLRV